MHADSVFLHIPGGLPAGIDEPFPLEADLRIEGEQGFGHVADIAGAGDGRFWVLDRAYHQLTLHDSNGAVLKTIGRNGTGPGEFSDPIAAAVRAANVVVWDLHRSGGFSVFDTAGTFQRVVFSSASGDWMPHGRRPDGSYAEVLRYQTTLEDLTKRLEFYDDTSFTHVLRPDERSFADGEDPAHWQREEVIRYSVTGRVIDTVATLKPPPTRPEGPVFMELLFSARPFWVSGNGWTASGHGDSSTVVVRRDGNGPLLIRLDADQRPIGTGDIEAHLNWLYDFLFEHGRPATRRRLEEMEKGQALKENLELARTRTARMAPRVTAAFAAGNCLWLAGFAAEDQMDGVSLTWTAVDVRQATVTAVVRIGRRWSRVRDMDARFIYTTFIDSMGVLALERWPVPATAVCR